MKNILTINEIHGINLELIKSFDEFCKKHNLKYYICYGTLLGAVRHKGFIPWDDDADLAMTRDEYERMITIYQKECSLNDRYMLSYSGNGYMHGGFAKWMDTHIALKRKYMFKGIDDSFLGIDIFPFDKVPCNSNTRKQILRKANLCRYLFDVSSLKLHNLFLNTIVQILLFPFHLIPLNVYDRWQNQIVKNASLKVHDENYVYMQITWNFSGINEIITKDDVRCNPEVITFEGEELPVFKSYKDFLKGTYGDYMTLPKESKRRTHDMYAEYIE